MGRNLSSIENEFLATRYHSLIIEESSLSEEFNITARSEDWTIMAIQHNSIPVTGIQFHPESIATEFGKITQELSRRILNYEYTRDQ